MKNSHRSKEYRRPTGTKTTVIDGQEVEVKVYATGRDWEKWHRDREDEIRKLNEKAAKPKPTKILRKGKTA